MSQTKRVADYSKPILRKSVQQARELLQKRALELVEEHIDTINEARADGKYEFALEAQRWLIEHIADDEGTRVIATSVDKEKTEEKRETGPMVQIGIQLGGVPQQPVIAAKPTPALVAITEVSDAHVITVPAKNDPTE